MLRQHSEYHAISDDGDGYYTDWIAVESEAEADLLNTLLDVSELEGYACRHLRSNNLYFFRTKGKEPHANKVAALRLKIMEKYLEAGDFLFNR